MTQTGLDRPAVGLAVRAYAAVIGAGCMWGSIGIWVRALNGWGYSPLTIVFVRMIIAFAILFPILGLTNRSLLRIKGQDLWVFVCAGLSSAIAINLFYSISLVVNALALAAVFIATAPFFVVLIAAVVFREPVTRRKVGALIVAFAGCVLTSGVIDSGATFNAFGVLMGVLSGIGYALYSLFSRAALNRGYNSLTVNVYSFGIGAIACVPFTNWGAIGQSIAAQPVKIGWLLLAHALFASLLPYIFFTYSLKYLDTGQASIMTSVDPVAATIIGVLLFSEMPSPTRWTGMVLVLVSIVLLNLKWDFSIRTRRSAGASAYPGRRHDAA